MLRSVLPSGMPRLPDPKRLKVGVLIVLALTYGVLFVALSRHSRPPPGPRYTAIPVTVVRTAPPAAAAPAAPAVQLQPPPAVEIPPPRIAVH